METIEKKKLITWLEKLAEKNTLSQAFYAIYATINEINKGSFDFKDGGK